MTDFIRITGAKENNLKSISLDIPKNCLVVITGPSGSGKSSLAFDTIYAEGQRRYLESLSAHARYMLHDNNKPDVESITGLSPSIAIDQKTTSKNPRSTVGTITEIYDYLRVLYARIGKFYSKDGHLVKKYNPSEVSNIIMKSFKTNSKIRICAPYYRKDKNTTVKNEINNIKQLGYPRVKIFGKVVELESVTDFTEESLNGLEIVIDRVIINHNGDRIATSIENAMKISDGIVKIDIFELNDQEFIEIDERKYKNGETVSFSEKLFCPVTGNVISNLEPNIFSFNSPFGACESCNGLGYEKFFDENLIIPNPDLSIINGAVLTWNQQNIRYYKDLAIGLARFYNFDVNAPYKDLPANIKEILINGSQDKIPIEVEIGMRRVTVNKEFKGIINEIALQHENSDEQVEALNYEKFQSLIDCKKCQGHRLKESSLQVRINEKNIGEVCRLDIDECSIWFEGLSAFLKGQDLIIANQILKEIQKRISFLLNVGLGYLSINRSSSTLSGGEAQRIRLASQIGSGLSGVIYVLDEPSIGLHQSDNRRLIESLKHLVKLNNSVIVVEHDEDTMRAADYLIDIGPGAGKYGGEIIAMGTVDEVCKNPNSITGKFLSGEHFIEVPIARRRYGKSSAIELKNAREHNLKNVNLKIPLGMFVAISGISGSGKSTLILDTLYVAIANYLNRSTTRPGLHDTITGIENINKIIKIDQDPIGRTPRSNPATYTGIFMMVRDIFTSLPESRARGYKSGRFSFNVKGGRCENCRGEGLIHVEMHFLPDVYIPCEVCHGKRYNNETLEIKHKGYSIADILEMTVREAYEVYQDHPAIKEKLKTLMQVGLDYVKLGQSSTTLSGGEAQRIKLSKELSKKATGDTFYILDEPTTGLHSSDIKKLLNVLHTLVDYGNTVLVIEHNLDVIKTADYVVDMGPKGGRYGGYVLSAGTPEEVAMDPNSITGPFLKPLLPKLNPGLKTQAE